MLLTRVGGSELSRDHEYVRSVQMSHLPYGKSLYPSPLLPVAGGEAGPKVIRERELYLPIISCITQISDPFLKA